MANAFSQMCAALEGHCGLLGQAITVNESVLDH
jgi:hypothetical protein